MHNINQAYKALTLLPTQIVDADMQSSVLNVGVGFGDDCMIIVSVGSIASAGTLDIDVQTSDAVDGDFTTVGSFGQITEQGTLATLGVDLSGENSAGDVQDFLRLDLDLSAGAGDTVEVGAILLIESNSMSDELNSSTFAEVPESESPY